MTGPGEVTAAPEFVFFAHQVADLNDALRRFTLSDEEISLLNPKTSTMATFRSQRVPVLILEQPAENLWNIVLKQGLFNMSSDSAKFQTHQDLERAGYTLQGNHFVRGKVLSTQREERYLPLYEAKMIHQFDTSDGSTRDMRLDELRNPTSLSLPPYWVRQMNVEKLASGSVP